MKKAAHTTMTSEQFRHEFGNKDPLRQYQGRVNRSDGLRFEAMIDDGCEYYRRQKIADIEKNSEPMRIIQSLPGGRFIACFARKAQPDYKGTLAINGRSVVFEAKHSSTGKIEQNRVKIEQAEALERHCSLGAYCFVIAGFDMNQFYRIPWHEWRDMKSRLGRQYIRPDDYENCKYDHYTIKANGHGLLFLD